MAGHLPDELGWFKEVTLGKPILMGRRTHTSIGRRLPGRVNIVVTRDADFKAPGCLLADSFEAALKQAGVVEEVVVIGGAALYAAALPMAGRIYLTRVHAEVEGDVLFPEVDLSGWARRWQRSHPRDARHPFAFTSMILERVAAPSAP